MDAAANDPLRSLVPICCPEHIFQTRPEQQLVSDNAAQPVKNRLSCHENLHGSFTENLIGSPTASLNGARLRWAICAATENRRHFPFSFACLTISKFCFAREWLGLISRARLNHASASSRRFLWKATTPKPTIASAF